MHFSRAFSLHKTCSTSLFRDDGSGQVWRAPAHAGICGSEGPEAFEKAWEVEREE